MSAIETLPAIAAELALHGEVRLTFGGKTLLFRGQPAAFANPSDAVILAATDTLPARNARKGETAADLAALVLERLGKAAA